MPEGQGRLRSSEDVIEEDKTKNPFDYPQDISKESKKALAKLTEAYATLWRAINQELPQSRRRSLAIQDLEKSEAMMAKAVAFHGTRMR